MPSRSLPPEQLSQPFAHRPRAEDLDLVIIAESTGDGVQEGSEMLITPALRIILPAARPTMPDTGLVADVRRTTHVRRDV